MARRLWAGRIEAHLLNTREMADLGGEDIFAVLWLVSGEIDVTDLEIAMPHVAL